MEQHGRNDEIQGRIVHVYDDIEEADNQLPAWWVSVFLGTIAFAIAYWFGFEVYATRPTPAQEYAAARQALDQRQRAELASATVLTEQVLVGLAANPQAASSGAAIYRQNCLPCHGDRGQGVIGPNLTDGYWLHGGAPLQVHHTVQAGVADKGMPAWGPVLGELGVRQVVAHLITLRNTRVPGKEPQGELDPAR